MDFGNYRKDGDGSSGDYFEFVDWLSGLTAADLRLSRGNAEEQRQALCRYWKRGHRADLTPGELVDFMFVSSPSILDMAGYGDREAATAVAISDSLTQEDISQTSLDAPQQLILPAPA